MSSLEAEQLPQWAAQLPRKLGPRVILILGQAQIISSMLMISPTVHSLKILAVFKMFASVSYMCQQPHSEFFLGVFLRFTIFASCPMLSLSQLNYKPWANQAEVGDTYL